MTLFVGSTVINVTDIDRGTAFWSAVLGYVIREGSADPTFVVLTDPRRRWSNVSLQLTDKPKRELNRLHLDLYADDYLAEVARLEQLGATRVVPWPYPPNAEFVVMADPDGNEFCVVQSVFTQD